MAKKRSKKKTPKSAFIKGRLRNLFKIMRTILSVSILSVWFYMMFFHVSGKLYLSPRFMESVPVLVPVNLLYLFKHHPFSHFPVPKCTK